MAKFFTDGSSTIGVKSAYIVTDESGKVLAFQETDTYQGKQFNYTNNEEEYRGVIEALFMAADGDEILSDSLLVVNQIKGLYKAKQPHLKALCDQAQELLKKKQVKVTWISRNDNKAGKHFE